MGVKLELLGQARIEGLLAQGMDLLASVGMAIEDPALLAFLGDHGHHVDPASGRAKFRQEGLLAAVASAPKRFSLFDRDLREVVKLGDGEVHAFPGSAALRVLDHGAARAREAVRTDLDRLGRVVDHLPAFHLQSTSLVPADVPVQVGDRVRLFHALVSCRKPVVTGTFRVDGFRPMQAMLEAVRGGAASLREHPLAIFDCCPTAPLTWPRLTTHALQDCARAGIPAEIIPVPLTGATGPVSLEGSLVQILAENLSGILIHQLTHPGSPLIWGGCPMSFDMKQGTTPTGSPETALLNAASAEVAHHLGLPCHGYLGLSDAKAFDPQAGYETAMGATLAALSGMDLVAGAGMLDFIGCLSLEKLVFDAAIAESAQRLRAGLSPRPGDDLGALFREALEGRGFLRMAHTRTHHRQELSRPSELIDRASQTLPHPDAASRCAAEVERLLALPPAGGLEEPKLRELEAILEAELAAWS